MDWITTIKETLGPSLRDFGVNFCFFGYFVIANVWTWYVFPEMVPVKNPYIIGMVVLCAIGGLLFGGLKGLVIGTLFVPAGIALINASFFPIFFICWLIALLFAFLTTIPFPIAGNAGYFIGYSLCIFFLLFLVHLHINGYGQKNDAPVSDEFDDYSSSKFIGDLWGGRWG
jgi:hypothetical protein